MLATRPGQLLAHDAGGAASGPSAAPNKETDALVEKSGGGMNVEQTRGEKGSTEEPVIPQYPVLVPSGPAGVGLEGVLAPKGATGAEPSGLELDPAQGLLERVFRDPALVLGRDIHRLLELGTDRHTSESVASALEYAVSKNPLVAEVLVTACGARLQETTDPASPVREVIVRALIAAVKTTPESTQHRTKVLDGIAKIGLTDPERVQIERSIQSDRPELLADLKNQLPLPRWYQRMFYGIFGEGHRAVTARAAQIQEKSELICSLAERGLLLDEVATLAGYKTSKQEIILQSLKRYVTQTSRGLPDSTQEALWRLVASDRLPPSFSLIVEDILLAGTVSKGVQGALAKQLQLLERKFPITEVSDVLVVRMCARMVDRLECSLELARLFDTATNHWQLGAHLASSNGLEELTRKVIERASKVFECAAGGLFETVAGYQAVVGTIVVGQRKFITKGQQLDTLLSEWSFNKTRQDQVAYAKKLGYRLATRAENLAYVEGLLAEEGNNTLNDAGKNALNTYRKRYVRDNESGLAVVDRRVRVNSEDGFAYDFPHDGALFVRASAESK